MGWQKAMLFTETLTLNECKIIADASEAKAIDLGIKIAIAIMDNHGNLKLYRRMDGNSAISIEMAQLKAYTSSRMPVSTKSLAERNASIENKPYLGVPGIVLLEGGLPIITKDHTHVGSIGISGATPELDGVCAEAGLHAIKHLLTIEGSSK